MRRVLLGKLPLSRLAFPSNRMSKVFYHNTSAINSADPSNEIPKETTSSSSVRPEIEYIDIKEGKASMVYAKDKAVFYNKVQIFNRDFSILVLRHFAEFRQKELQAKYEDRMQRYTGLKKQSKIATDTATHLIRLLLALSMTSQTIGFHARAYRSHTWYHSLRCSICLW
jgi:N2,N2-dimethylguanosine tRNA methyltransferase